MRYDMQTQASRSYACGYYCHHCGKFNVEIGTLTETAVTTTGRQPDAAAQQQNEAKARVALNGKYAQLRSKVNSFQEFELLEVPGKCTGCGQEQIWARKASPKRAGRRTILTLACLCLVGGVVSLTREGQQWLFAPGLILGIACLWWALRASARAKQTAAQRQNQRAGELLRGETRWNCFPYVAAAGDPVRRGDSRAELLQEVFDLARRSAKHREEP